MATTTRDISRTAYLPALMKDAVPTFAQVFAPGMIMLTVTLGLPQPLTDWLQYLKATAESAG